MKLTVKTRHEPNERQSEMIKQYVRQDNKKALAYDDECNMIYALTALGHELYPQSDDHW